MWTYILLDLDLKFENIALIYIRIIRIQYKYSTNHWKIMANNSTSIQELDIESQLVFFCVNKANETFSYVKEFILI